MTNFRKIAGMTNLKKVLGIESLHDLNAHESKAVTNIKYCSNDAWCWVNSVIDGYDEDRDMVMSPKRMYRYIYDESLITVFTPGMSCGGKWAEEYLNDIKFAGKKFLQTVTFFYTMRFIEDAFEELDGTDEEEASILTEINQLKAELNI